MFHAYQNKGVYGPFDRTYNIDFEYAVFRDYYGCKSDPGGFSSTVIPYRGTVNDEFFIPYKNNRSELHYGTSGKSSILNMEALSIILNLETTLRGN